MNILNKLMEFLKQKRWLLASLLMIVVLFAFDIWTKRLAFSRVDRIIEKTMGVHTHVRINDYINVVKVVNNGVSFGFFNTLSYGQYILSAITLAIVVFVAYLLFKTDEKYNMVCYSLIIAGGLGNLYDRLVFGGVFDFLDAHLGEYHWPAFNFADSIICIGVFLIILDDAIKYIKNHNTNIIQQK